jgi:hypothetical protein
MFLSIIVKPFIKTLDYNIRWKIKGYQKATSNELKGFKNIYICEDYAKKKHKMLVFKLYNFK